jgi:predicted Zn finger-like uncharacterized protein
MPIRTVCPECGHVYRMAATQAGKKLRCTECKAVFTAPAADEDENEDDRLRSRTQAAPSSSPSKAREANDRIARPQRSGQEEARRRPGRAADGQGMNRGLIIGGVALLLLLVVGGGIIGGILLFRDRGKDSSSGARDRDKETPPAITEPNKGGQPARTAKLPTPLVLWTNKETEGVPEKGVKGLRVYYRGKFIRAVPLTAPIRERSFEIWLTISNLDQREATVFGLFDAVETWDGLLYAEKAARQWYPGSSYGHRSRNPGGEVETAEPNELVHLVIGYASDGTITMYRNGRPYGSPFNPGGKPEGTIRTYPANTSHLFIGAGSDGGHTLEGEVTEARLYNRPLTPVEVKGLFDDGKMRLSRNAPKVEDKAANAATGPAQSGPTAPKTVQASTSIPNGKDEYTVSVAVSKDGRLVIAQTSGNTGFAQIWDVQEKKKLQEFNNGAGYKVVAMAPDGKTSANVSFSIDISIRDVATGMELRKLKPKNHSLGFPTDLVFSSAGDLLVMASGEYIVGWNPATGEEKFDWKADADKVTALSNLFDADRKIATGNEAGIVKIWDIGTGKVLKTLTRAKADMIVSLAISPNGRTLVSSSVSGPIEIWDLAQSKVSYRILDAGLWAFVLVLPDGKTLVYTDGKTNDIVLADLGAGTRKYVLEGHKKLVRSLSATPDGATLVSGSEDTTCKVWDLKTLK